MIKFDCWHKGVIWFAYSSEKNRKLGKYLACIQKTFRCKREYLVKIKGRYEIKDCTTRTLRKAKQVIREVLGETDKKRFG